MVFREFKCRDRIHGRSFLGVIGFHAVYHGTSLHSGLLCHVVLFCRVTSQLHFSVFRLIQSSELQAGDHRVRINMLSTTACSIDRIRIVHGWPYVIVAKLPGFICAHFVQITCRYLQFRVFACAGVLCGRQWPSARGTTDVRAMTATGNPAKVVSCRCEIAQLKRLVIMRGWNSNGQPGWPRMSHD